LAIRQGYETALPGSSRFCLTAPDGRFPTRDCRNNDPADDGHADKKQDGLGEVENLMTGRRNHVRRGFQSRCA
tara:strand:+ start:5952 stop:6170 length:219 start_codon:yes stop_codon:yes gene_type:complete